ncbi:hypothetical protein V6N12_055230 [Hibiscus sabdariffa]|uniref:Uncharacterized protein n=1 Tax=Hibiscus sabdariffa TaxID=183260 RepID=A0ABR2BMN4_9ROSI
MYSPKNSHVKELHPYCSEPIYLEGGLLRSLHLNGNQLEGSLPTSLGKCKTLQVLDLGNNNLNGTFPYWLANLPNLQVLVL